MTGRGTTIDWTGFTAAFQGVFIEGLEVVFIVVAIGGADHNLSAATLGATAAAVLVVLARLIVHRPITQLPENALKYLVAVMLSTLGAFWVGEGLRLEWPGGDWSLVGLMVAYFVTFRVAVQWAKHLAANQWLQPMTPGGSPRSLFAAAREIWRLFVGDISHAIAILAWVAVVAILTNSIRHAAWIGPVLFLGRTVILIENVTRAARGAQKKPRV
jgi:Ca2+/H+ antiporter, TMEM165/GDT1 family